MAGKKRNHGIDLTKKTPLSKAASFFEDRYEVLFEQISCLFDEELIEIMFEDRDVEKAKEVSIKVLLSFFKKTFENLKKAKLKNTLPAKGLSGKWEQQ